MVRSCYHVVAIAALLTLACATSSALAAARGVVYPGNCTIPAFIVGSPDGAFPTQVVVRDIANNPVGPSDVYLDFGGCAQPRGCATVCAGCTVTSSGQYVDMTSTDAGVAAFALRMSGSGCPNPPSVRIWADGILLGSTNFASVDQDGDMTVTSADLAMAHALLGTHDLRADFDGDGTVTDADLAILQAHMGAGCARPVPVRTSTWGEVKSIYR